MKGTTTDCTVLLVDDSWYIRSLVEQFLSDNGYEVTSVGDGEMALEAFRKHDPDVVLMDLVLPGMSGTEACMEIRKIQQEACVLFMTGLVDDVTEREIKDAGAAAVVPKPVALEQLKQTIQAATSMDDTGAATLKSGG